MESDEEQEEPREGLSIDSRESVTAEGRVLRDILAFWRFEGLNLGTWKQQIPVSRCILR